MWSILENVPCALEKKVYSSAFGWDVLKISMRSISPNVSFRISVALLIFCPEELSIDVSGVLKSPTIIIVPSVSPFMSISICSTDLGASVLGAYISTCVKSFLYSSFYHYIVSFFIFLMAFVSKSILSDMSTV